MPTTTVSETTWTEENDNGEEIERTQYKTTIPKSLAEAFDLSGADIEWKVESGNKLSITKIDD